MNVNAEFVNPFLKAASIVFKSVIGVELRRGKLIVKNHPEPSHEVAIIIGITGGIQGMVVYSLPLSMVYKISEILVPGLSKEQIDAEYKDIMGELANMITGNAMNLFMDLDEEVEVTTPTVINGQDFTVTHLQQTTLGLNFYSSIGTLEMNVALK